MTARPVRRPLLVDRAGDVALVVAAAGRAGVIGVDTESNSLHAYTQRLCILQVSADGANFVLDTLELSREALEPLLAVFADPKTVKILHGADYDLRMLDHELAATVSGLRDTQVAAQLLGIRETGLANLAARELDVTLDKRHQLADWGARPLGPELLDYASADTAYLPELAARLESHLAEMGRLAWWQEECEALERIRWIPQTPDPLAFERIMKGTKLKGEARDRVAALHSWREGVAAALDRPPFKVMQGDTVLKLAQLPPTTVEELASVRGVGPSVARRHGAALVELLASPPPAPPRQPREWVRPPKERADRLKELGVARDLAAASLDIDPAVLAPRAALENVAEELPDDEAALQRCLGRRWRTEVLAGTLLPLVVAWRQANADPH